jgi:hypothetical protein
VQQLLLWNSYVSRFPQLQHRDKSHPGIYHNSTIFANCGSICIKDLDDAAYEALIVAEIGRLRAQINEKAFCELASSLNNGEPCVIGYSPTVFGSGALMGCANCHARIRFGNGSPSWLLRVSRVSSFAVGFPVSLAEYLIRSEYATLKFLETTAVPAPRAFSFGIPSQGTDHGIGVCFLLMEELCWVASHSLMALLKLRLYSLHWQLVSLASICIIDHVD